MQTNAPECAIRGKHQKSSLSSKADFCAPLALPWHLYLLRRRKGNQTVWQGGSCSTGKCKNIPEFSVTYWHSGFTGFLKMGQRGLPAMFCPRRAEETTRVRLLSQPGFPLKPAKSISFCKTPQERRHKDTVNQTQPGEMGPSQTLH